MATAQPPRRRAATAVLGPAEVLALQRSAGNRAVARTLAARAPSGPRLQRVIVVRGTAAAREQPDGNLRITTLEALKKWFPRADDAEYFNDGSQKSWEKRLGRPAWKKPDARLAWAKSMVGGVQGMLDSGDAYVLDFESRELPKIQLINKASEYIRATNEAKAPARLTAATAHQGDELDPTLSPLAAALFASLMATKRILSVPDLYDTAQKAKPGSGFLYELEIALRVLERRPDAYALFGRHPLWAIPDLIPSGYELAEGKKTHQEGAIGADVIILHPSPHAGPESGATRGSIRLGASFIQSKRIKAANLKEQALAAANQLAGDCARGEATAEARENTLVGEDFRGVIYVYVTDREPSNAESVATQCLASPYVHEFVLEVLLGGTDVWGKTETGGVTKLAHPTLEPPPPS